jgi:hypothetical protein
MTSNSPINGQCWSNAVFTVTGKAGDKVAMAAVYVHSSASGAWTEAMTTNNWKNWSVAVNLAPGTNLISAYAVDTSGNVSKTNTVSMVYVQSALLQIVMDGEGAILPNYNNALLPVGESFSMTANGTNGFALGHWVVSTNWAGGVAATSATVNVVMVSNLTLQANFVDFTPPTLSITNPVASQIFTQSPINAGGTKAGAAFCQSPQMKNSWFENYATEQMGGLASGQPFG